jgi:hypothetical protein
VCDFIKKRRFHRQKWALGPVVEGVDSIVCQFMEGVDSILCQFFEGEKLANKENIA